MVDFRVSTSFHSRTRNFAPSLSKTPRIRQSRCLSNTSRRCVPLAFSLKIRVNLNTYAVTRRSRIMLLKA